MEIRRGGLQVENGSNEGDPPPPPGRGGVKGGDDSNQIFKGTCAAEQGHAGAMRGVTRGCELSVLIAITEAVR